MVSFFVLIISSPDWAINLLLIFVIIHKRGVGASSILLKTLVPESRWGGAVLFTLLPKGAGFSFAYKTFLTMSFNMVNLMNTRFIWKEG